MMNEYGLVRLNLEEMINKRGISKTQLSYKAQMSHTQINRFCHGLAGRIDFATLARLCTVLECDISELLIYEPPCSDEPDNKEN